MRMQRNVIFYKKLFSKKNYSLYKNFFMEDKICTFYEVFDIWLAIDNGKILLCSCHEKDCIDFAKNYELVYGYEIQVISMECIK